jgi:hypothetical protein
MGMDGRPRGPHPAGAGDPRAGGAWDRDADHGAGRKLTRVVGSDLDDEPASRRGAAPHYGVGASGGPVALALVQLGQGPRAAGLVVATAMAVIVDEGANTILGLTPPPSQGPFSTHLRGFAAHLVYGAALGLLSSVGRDD